MPSYQYQNQTEVPLADGRGRMPSRRNNDREGALNVKKGTNKVDEIGALANGLVNVDVLKKQVAKHEVTDAIKDAKIATLEAELARERAAKARSAATPTPTMPMNVNVNVRVQAPVSTPPPQTPPPAPVAPRRSTSAAVAPTASPPTATFAAVTEAAGLPMFHIGTSDTNVAALNDLGRQFEVKLLDLQGAGFARTFDFKSKHLKPFQDAQKCPRWEQIKKELDPPMLSIRQMPTESEKVVGALIVAAGKNIDNKKVERVHAILMHTPLDVIRDAWQKNLTVDAMLAAWDELVPARLTGGQALSSRITSVPKGDKQRGFKTALLDTVILAAALAVRSAYPGLA